MLARLVRFGAFLTALATVLSWVISFYFMFQGEAGHAASGGEGEVDLRGVLPVKVKYQKRKK